MGSWSLLVWRWGGFYERIVRGGVRRHPHFHSDLNYLIAEKGNEKDLYRFQIIRDCFRILPLPQCSILL